MLRNLNQSSGGKRVLGTPKVGVLGSALPATGQDGPSILYNDAALPADNSVAFSAEVLTWPAAGSLFVYEDGSFVYSRTAAGSASFQYLLRRDGVLQAGINTVTLQAGFVGGAATGALPAVTVTPALASAAAVGGVTTSLTLSSVAGVTLGAFCVGQAFKRGAIPSGYVPVAALANFQATVKNRWPDGSVKFAVLAGRVTIPAGGTVSVSLSAGIDPGGTALTETAITASGVSASIGFGAFGSVTLSSLIGQVSTFTSGRYTAGMVRQWVAGPEMSSWIYYSRIAGHAHLSAWFEVRVFAGGAVQILPWLENATLMVASPTSYADTLSFTLNGTQVMAQPITLYHHTRTVAMSGTASMGYWHGAANDIVFKHDTAYLQQTNLVPSYMADSTGSSRLTALLQTYAPLQQGGYSDDMSGTGAQPGIALLGDWDALYITSRGDPRAFRYALAQAYSAGRYPVHVRDETTLQTPRAVTYPTLVYGGSQVYSPGSSTTSTTTPATTGGGNLYDTAHHPSMGYLAYLLTGQFYHAETVMLLNCMNWLHEGDINWRRDGAKGIYQSYSTSLQTRGAGWSIRTLAQALTVAPDADTAHSDLQAQWQYNADAYYNAYVVTSNNPFGVVHPHENAAGTSDPFTHKPWMDDFVTQSWGYAIAMDLPASAGYAAKLTAFMDWKSRAAVGRLGPVGDANTYGFTDAGYYVMPAAPTNAANWDTGAGPWYANWGAIYLATTGFSNATNTTNALRNGYPDTYDGYWANLQPAIAYSKQLGTTGAAAAYARLTGASNYTTLAATFTDNPAWGVVPGSSAVLGVGNAVGGLPALRLGAMATANVAGSAIGVLVARSMSAMAGTASGVGAQGGNAAGIMAALGISPILAYAGGAAVPPLGSLQLTVSYVQLMPTIVTGEMAVVTWSA